jgi:glutaminyl-tRNA synthetase
MGDNMNEAASDFIRDIVAGEVKAGKHRTVVTRFPPEPNGYIHIGHAKAAHLDFGLAAENGGRCHLRFDDTDPAKEDIEYVDSIIRDTRWLGFDWGEHLYYASDYYEQTYQCAEDLIRRGLAYVCELTQEEFKDYRGSPTAPGREPPGRNRPPDENLALFRRMRAGEFEEGQRVLRARIDMASPNIHLRDPVIYRIKKAEHYRTGRAWCIYPMYDFAHPIGDAIEGITHSLCTLEYEVHRPLYDWVVANCNLPAKPRQIEFSRLSLSYTVMSKRKLLELVKGGFVAGWDDPRLPTVCALRRRGYTPESIRAFCRKIGVTKFDGITDVALLEHCIRDELNRTATRVMAVLKPLKVVLTNYPEGKTEEIDAVNNPENPDSGTRSVPFGRELFIEQDDFMEVPPKQFFRLAPGREVRLRYGYFITCGEVVKDPATGAVTELRCTYDPATRGGNAPDGRKVKATIHWVSAAHAAPVETRLYDRLFGVEEPDNVPEGVDFKTNLNPKSLEVVTAMAEPFAARTAEPGASRFQFERKGYFFADPVDSRPGKPVFNQIVPLKDTWAKIEQKKGARG